MVRQGHYDRLFIGGSWVEPATAERIDVISPVTEEPIASVPAGAPSDIDRAVVAARAAFEGGWARSPLDERVGILERLRDRLVEVGEEMAQVITAEMGCPITQSRAIQVVAPLGTLDAHLELARTYPFREVRHSPGGATALIVREPDRRRRCCHPLERAVGNRRFQDRPGDPHRVHGRAEALAGGPAVAVLPGRAAR